MLSLFVCEAVIISEEEGLRFSHILEVFRVLKSVGVNFRCTECFAGVFVEHLSSSASDCSP